MAEILIVEDNSAIRMAYRLLLKNVGYAVTEAVDGLDAIAKLGPGRYDLIITDLWMPGADGFAVIAEAKRVCPETRVLAVTGGMLGNDAADPSSRATAAGADAVIEKPMLGDGLLAVVASLVGNAVIRRPAGVRVGENTLTP